MKKAILILFAALVLAALLIGCTESTVILPSEGIDKNMTLIQDINFDSSTSTTCDIEFVDGVIKSTTCS